jgi:hypothetical protein
MATKKIFAHENIKIVSIPQYCTNGLRGPWGVLGSLDGPHDASVPRETLGDSGGLGELRSAMGFMGGLGGS